MAIAVALLICAGVGYTFYGHREVPKEAGLAEAVTKHTVAELQPLLNNRCFQTKTPDEQNNWMKRLDAMPDADFKKTIEDLAVVNAADHALGTQGCETPK